MRLIRHPRPAPSASRGSVAALGRFDGFHLGQRRAVERAVELARQEMLAPAAIVLHVPPLESAEQDGAALTTLRQLLSLLDDAGVESVVLQRPARPGAEGIDVPNVTRLLGALNARAIVVDRETRLGGDVEIESLARRFGVSVEVPPAVAVDETEVTRARVRDALGAGDLALVERLLGRRYELCGRVVHGHHRGKGLGIPTANLRPRGLELPADGVYAVWAQVSGRRLPAVANVGKKPTFGDLERTIETHILDFDEDVYGRLLCVEFVLRLRGEVRFPGVEALLEQIRADVARARLTLAP